MHAIAAKTMVDTSTVFGDEVHRTFLELVLAVREQGKESCSGQGQFFPCPPDREKALLEAIVGQRASLESASGYLLRTEIELSEEVASASSLPPQYYLERILRYQTTHDRRFYRAMETLERLQEHRKGWRASPSRKLPVPTAE